MVESSSQPSWQTLPDIEPPFPEVLNGLARQCFRASRWVLLATIGAFLLLLLSGRLGALNLMQLAGTEADVATAVEALGGESGARTTVLFNLLLLIPWTALLIGLAFRIRLFYYSQALEKTAQPVIWGLLFALGLGLLRSAVLLWQLPDVTGGWLIASSAAGWVTWVFVILAVLYTLPMLLSRWLPAQRYRTGGSMFTLDPVTAAQVRDLDPSLRAPKEFLATWKLDTGRAGVSVSGGGVRSAAFNLGAFQALDENQLYEKARFVTAVSGGSYIAGAYAMARLRGDDSSPGTKPFGRSSPEEDFLRHHSTYLAPGFSGVMRLLARLTVGIAINVLLIGLAVFVGGAVVGFFLSSYLLYPELRGGTDFTVHANTWWAVGSLAASALAVAFWPSLRRQSDEGRRDTWFIVAGLLLVMSALILVLHVAIPWTITSFPAFASGLLGASAGEGSGSGANLFWWLQIAGIGSILAGAVRAVVAKNRSWLATVVAGVIVPILVLVGFFFAVNTAAKDGLVWDEFGLFWMTVVAACVLLVMVATSDLTTWSMHPFYKRRLASAFAVRRSEGKARSIAYGELPAMSELADSTPELVVCGAANVTDPGLTPPGRYALTFTFAGREIGGPEVGWVDTGNYEQILGSARKEDMTVPAAVAISGAAVSPAMGKMGRGKRALSSILALANVRLGVWLPNPRWVLADKDGAAGAMRPPRATYLLKELMGRYSVDDRFLYVTDGGHWENLGLVELLRRGCGDVFCFDAAGDAPGKYFTLGEAIALARSELNIDIDLDPLVMRPEDTSSEPVIVPQGHAFGKISKDGRQIGRILYVKAGLTADAPWDVRAYGEKNSDFPNQPTFDQLFEDDQFEAYRALGHRLTSVALQERESAESGSLAVDVDLSESAADSAASQS